MAFKQSNNPISRKTSPLRAGGFTMKDIEDKSTAEKISSIEESRSGNVGAPGDPGTQPNYNDAKKFAGDDEGMLKHKMSPEEYDEKYTAPSRKASPLNKDKTDYTLDGKPLTRDNTGYDPSKLISDQSKVADKKAIKEYDAEQREKAKAKPKPKPKPKPKNKRNQAILDARKAKEPKAKENKVSLEDRKKKLLAERAKKNK